MAQIDDIILQIESVTGLTCQPYQSRSISGGCINSAYHLQTPSADFFIKINRPELADMFAAEAQGLIEMATIKAIRVPEVVCFGETSSCSFLVLEYIPLRSLNGTASRILGEQLAQLHLTPQAYFGWHRDNTIGSTPQINTPNQDWVHFWQQQRIAQQLRFAKKNGFGGQIQRDGERLIEAIPAFFTTYQPAPSLLHGDLWTGNASTDEHGQPVIYDPACYYGDAETDLAMTELFGHFGHDFFAAYHAVNPIDVGYRSRKTLYNLYHILNHVNLFGGGYIGQAEAMCQQLLAEVKG